MVTKVANARRKAFLNSKKEYGDIEQMTKAFHKSKFTVWFDDDGDIKCCSKEPNEVFDKKFNSAQFSDDEVAIFKNANWGLYKVRTDDKVDSVHYIELRPIDDIITKQDDFLSEIEEGSVRGADIKVKVEGKKFTVELCPRVIKEYKNVDPDTAVVRGQTTLKFYFTTYKEPSFLEYNFNVPFRKLLVDKKIDVILPYEMDQSSIYTVKLFDKYVRI